MNSEIILANAERFYVIERMTEKEVAQQVGVHERTIRRWKVAFTNVTKILILSDIFSQTESQFIRSLTFKMESFL